MKKHINIRYRERDYIYKITKVNNDNMTEETIQSMLGDESEWADLTFQFYPTASGFQTKIIDNSSEAEILLDDLGEAALDFYLQEVKRLSEEKVKQSPQFYIEQIRELLHA